MARNHNAPRAENSRLPLARCKALEYKIARDFEDTVSDLRSMLASAHQVVPHRKATYKIEARQPIIVIGTHVQLSEHISRSANLEHLDRSSVRVVYLLDQVHEAHEYKEAIVDLAHDLLVISAGEARKKLPSVRLVVIFPCGNNDRCFIFVVGSDVIGLRDGCRGRHRVVSMVYADLLQHGVHVAKEAQFICIRVGSDHPSNVIVEHDHSRRGQVAITIHYGVVMEHNVARWRFMWLMPH